jgi:hypothetical protein
MTLIHTQSVNWMRCYLVGIDGTLANCEHRVQYVSGKDGQAKDWDAFYAATEDDTPHQHIIDLVAALWLESDIVLVSERPEHTREATQRWLSRYDIKYEALYMRADGDHRADDVIKIEILAKLCAAGFDPILALDHRTRVVKAWRAAGVPCLQVADGDF